MKFAAIIGLSVVVLAVPASAQDSRCTSMRDKDGCNCALQNGGWITPQGGWRYPGRGQEGFVACMKRRGRS